MKQDAIESEAVVLEVLPNTIFKVKLENGMEKNARFLLSKTILP